MSDNWYYSIDGTKQGPVDTQTLRQMASAGQLQAQHVVWKQGMADWVEVGKVPELSAQPAPGVQPAAGVQPAPGVQPAAPAAAQGGIGKAVAALILGISAIVTPPLGLVTGIIAIVLGGASLRKLRRGKGMAVGGIITGSVGIVISLIVALVSLIVPVIRSSIGDSHKTVCATKLHTITDSFAKYEDTVERGAFPRLAAKGDPDDLLKDGNTLDTATLGTNTMQNVWVLIDTGFLPGIAFQCPADAGYQPKSMMTRYGWASYRQFSYGMQNPYNAGVDGDPVNKAVPINTSTYKANYVFFADMNPGGPAARRGHSNHPDGCNVATRNGNVWFHKEKDSSVVYGEEIYGDDSYSGDAWPDSSTDVIITPTDPKGSR